MPIVPYELPWIKEARLFIGKHPRREPWFVKLLEGDPKDFSHGFVSGCLRACQFSTTDFNSAQTYAHWGRKLYYPAYGAITVIGEETPAPKGPGSEPPPIVPTIVGFIVGNDIDGHPIILAGHEAPNVEIKLCDKSLVLTYRWPDELKTPPVDPLPVYNKEKLNG